jgi:hypothetical protein
MEAEDGWPMLHYGYKASKGFPKFPDTLLIADLVLTKILTKTTPPNRTMNKNIFLIISAEKFNSNDLCIGKIQNLNLISGDYCSFGN